MKYILLIFLFVSQTSLSQEEVYRRKDYQNSITFRMFKVHVINLNSNGYYDIKVYSADSRKFARKYIFDEFYEEYGTWEKKGDIYILTTKKVRESFKDEFIKRETRYYYYKRGKILFYGGFLAELDYSDEKIKKKKKYGFRQIKI